MNKLPAIEGGNPVREKSEVLIFGRPEIKDEDINNVVEVLKSGWLSTGPKTREFENDFAKYQGVDYALATNSCTSALFLALKALDLPDDSEIITTNMTFCATINSILHAGLKPVVVDCERDTFNIDPEKVEAAITSKTRAILPVHFAGLPCNMTELREICDRYNLYLVSDCAHAIESRVDGRSMAELSDLAAYSLYSTKTIAAAEGGFLLSNNKEWADSSRMRSLHGMSLNAEKRYSSDGFKHYQINTLGYKMNMPDVLAALGINQLKRVDDSWNKRKVIWEKYMKELSNLPIILPFKNQAHTRHAYHLFTILIKPEELKVGRDHILNAIQAENITTGVHYNPIHTHSFYQQFNWTNDYTNSTFIGERTLSLPIAPNLTEKDTNDVIEAVRKIMEYYKK